ncbi:hypothetical protein ACIPWL_03835 [Streptomyces sp. NPDC090023]|uniref:hypothetical protein n=1 Tax=unclassified Streptomyces TaxID=2593676 RepID=UPI003818F414
MSCSSGPPSAPGSDECPAPTRPELDAMVHFALDAAVTGVENHPARVPDRA